MSDFESRVYDYLDDRLQTLTDLESLDELLDNVKTQQSLLRKQLEDAKLQHERSGNDVRDHRFKLHASIQSFNIAQSQIDDSLRFVTQSASTEDAISRFENVMDVMTRLDTANSYIDMTQEIVTKSQQCLDNLRRDTNSALSTFHELETFEQGLVLLQTDAEGSAPHLIDRIHQQIQSVREAIVNSLCADLEITLNKTGWPKPTAKIPSALQNTWNDQIANLLALQLPTLLRLRHANNQKISKDEPVVLLPCEMLVKPLTLRFQYHFSGDRMTNRIDRPEYFLNHILDLIGEHSDFLDQALQALLLQHFRKTDLVDMPAYTDVISAWITALLPLAQRKIKTLLPQVIQQPRLLSNLIHEIMDFDRKLAEEWNYSPLSTSSPYRGLSHYTLSVLDMFPTWFNNEKEFALNRYESIISDKTSGEISFDGAAPDSTRPTRAAIQVHDLLEAITAHYKPLASFHQKLKFLIDIQVAIFDRFHHRLHESLEAYLTRTSTVGRTVHSVDDVDNVDLRGTKGLDRLCRIYGSAEFIEKAIREWSNETFFIELWAELQYKIQHKGDIKGGISIDHPMNQANDSNDDLNGGLFDETATSYGRLQTRCEETIIDTITYDLRTALKPFGKVNTWASMSVNTSATSLTAELEPAMRLIDEYLGYLGKVMSRAPLRRITRKIGQTFQGFVWDSIIQRYIFSITGAVQLLSDVKGIGQIIDRHIGANEGIASLRKLTEALQLLTLPVRAGTVEGSIARAEDEPELKHNLGLWQVERRIFQSNESARELLDSFGLVLLTQIEARDVIKRRVELGS